MCQLFPCTQNAFFSTFCEAHENGICNGPSSGPPVNVLQCMLSSCTVVLSHTVYGALQSYNGRWPLYSFFKLNDNQISARQWPSSRLTGFLEDLAVRPLMAWTGLSCCKWKDCNNLIVYVRPISTDTRLRTTASYLLGRPSAMLNCPFNCHVRLWALLTRLLCLHASLGQSKEYIC
jgi:hypothetical protein